MLFSTKLHGCKAIGQWQSEKCKCGELTQPSIQPDAKRLFGPSSARYLARMFAPSENPTPSNGALGYREAK